ncbi:hypothetical protein J0656_05935 [Muricauda ruestringensis]|uniref:Uncharacterized protein n=1 Tax=Flagellimonas aurea TaxID=2915619 RepID=A0ABS3G380_9FLAO|nr:hypothetical protein [Allomuricauda aurea]MBO0353552.1 hypothetical protein [Allomuricauda aurea]
MDFFDRMYTLRFSKLGTRVVNILLVVIICFNLVNLYFVFDLYSYHEIIKYLPDNSLKSQIPRKLAIPLYLNTLANILLLFICLMSRLSR